MPSFGAGSGDGLGYVFPFEQSGCVKLITKRVVRRVEKESPAAVRQEIGIDHIPYRVVEIGYTGFELTNFRRG